MNRMRNFQRLRERFETRAEMLMAEDEFWRAYCGRRQRIKLAACRANGITLEAFETLPPEAELGALASALTEALARWLDQRDPGVCYKGYVASALDGIPLP